MEQWKIQRNRSLCKKTGCPLASEQEFYAILELPECIRLERCAACFTEIQRDAPEMPFHWKVRRTLGGNKPVMDIESLRALFDRLGEVTDPVEATADGEPAGESPPSAVSEAAAEAEDDADGPAPGRDAAGLRYLLALLLLRKRRLKMVDPKTAEQEQADLLVIDPKQPEMEPIALADPELDPERIEALREDLLIAIGEEPDTQTTQA